MNKILFCLVLLVILISCITSIKKLEDDKSLSLLPPITEPKCTYTYFTRTDGKLDSNFLFCPDPKPEGIPK